MSRTGRPVTPLEQRLWPLVDKTETCWLWRGGRWAQGYGRITAGGRSRKVHRVVYELLVGPVPDDLHLDHLCRVRECCNPAHLEPVSSRVNTLRGIGLPAINAKKTHCVNGHPFDEKNTYRWRETHRFCLACISERSTRYRAARKATA